MSNAIVIDGWRLVVEGGEPRVRDLDLGERAGLARPRDVRRAIRAAAQDGAVIEHRAGERDGSAAKDGPRVWLETEDVAIGSGAAREADVYYLNEAAALVVLTRLRTKVAVQVTQAIVRVFMAARRGELAAPAAPAPAAALAPGGIEAYREGVAALERARAEGAIDGVGLAVRQAHLLKRYLEVDILSAPPTGFAALPEVANLPPGKSLVVVNPVDTTGLSTASAIGRAYALPAAFVGKVAREIGVFGKEGLGAWVEVLVNGQSTKRKNWLYADDAISVLAPHLETEAARRWEETLRKVVGPKRLTGQRSLAIVPPAAAPASGPRSA